jgi:chemotaxis protein histidine kinase CheA
MDAAKQEMEKLAEKMAKGEVSEKQAQEAAKAMEKAAKEMEKRQADRESAADKKVAQAEKDVAKAEEKVAKAKNDGEKKEAERKLQDKQKQLDQAQKDKKDQQASEEKRTLKRLQRNMKQASQQMQDKNQENRRMASRTMEDMARDTGKVDSDQRKMTNQKKVASQLDDLKEAMRRAKRGGTRGPEDRFGRNKRNADFQRRARGGKGSKQAWKPGQGQKGPGQGNQPGGKGNQPGGSSYGDEHDPDLFGDPTKRMGNAKDESVSGVHGKGPSIKETIVSAAQKGFATKAYKDVYGRYKPAIEEVINSEKVPSGYKYYVKKYFQKIKPHAMD